MKAKTSVICGFLFGFFFCCGDTSFPQSLKIRVCSVQQSLELLSHAVVRIAASNQSLNKGINVFQKEKGGMDRINNVGFFGRLIPTFLMAAELFVALDVAPPYTCTFFLTVKVRR